jgi:hypothetical protein
MKMKNELMIDIETTGQKPGCKVLSLGAYGFDKDGFPTEFYKRFSIAKQDAEYLDDDQDTMAWWFKQGQDAMQEAFSGEEIRASLELNDRTGKQGQMKKLMAEMKRLA